MKPLDERRVWFRFEGDRRRIDPIAAEFGAVLFSFGEMGQGVIVGVEAFVFGCRFEDDLPGCVDNAERGRDAGDLAIACVLPLRP